MRIIRPIDPVFGSSFEKNPKQTLQSAPETTENLPVVRPARNQQRDFRRPSVGHCQLAAQLLAGPVRRGLRASASERERYYAAYRPAPSAQSVKQKWA